MLDPKIAFDGWATAALTALVLGAAVTYGLNALAARREFRTARETAKVDLWRNLVWLAYRDWQRRHPDKSPRDHHFGSFDLFPTYAPVVIRRNPEAARSLLFIHGWVQYERSGTMPHGWSLSDDDRIDLTEQAKLLERELRLGWNYDLLDRLFWERDFTIR